MDKTGDPLFVLLHVPKTGGTSLLGVFRRNLGPTGEFVHLDTLQQNGRGKSGTRIFAEQALEVRARARVLVGHDIDVRTHRLVPGKTPKYFTFLRPSADRIVSAYNFEAHEFFDNVGRSVPSFEAWYRRQERDVVTKFLAKRVLPGLAAVTRAQLERAAQYALRRGSSERVYAAVNSALEQFWFVGVTRDLDRISPALLQRFGIQDSLTRELVSGRDIQRRQTLTPELEARLVADNALDERLYRYWASRSTEVIDRINA